MATISTHDNVFTVGYEALGNYGAKHHFENQYTADARVIFERRLDPLSLAERWLEEHRRTSPEQSPPVRHGIYQRSRFAGFLAFLDQSEADANMFLNWRCSAASTYSRVPVGSPRFILPGREAQPLVSDIVCHADYLGAAWVRARGKIDELVFTRVSTGDKTVAEHIIANDVPLITSVSAANIDANVIVVRHTAILKEGTDADVVAYFLNIETTI